MYQRGEIENKTNLPVCLSVLQGGTGRYIDKVFFNIPWHSLSPPPVVLPSPAVGKRARDSHLFMPISTPAHAYTAARIYVQYPLHLLLSLYVEATVVHSIHTHSVLKTGLLPCRVYLCTTGPQRMTTTPTLRARRRWVGGGWVEIWSYPTIERRLLKPCLRPCRPHTHRAGGEREPRRAWRLRLDLGACERESLRCPGASSLHPISVC